MLVAAAGLWAALPREAAGQAIKGLGAAWVVSAACFAALAAARERSMRAFLWTYGGGLAARVLVLAGLMIAVWGLPWGAQAARLLAYVFGVMGFLLLEVRHLEKSNSISQGQAPNPNELR